MSADSSYCQRSGELHDRAGQDRDAGHHPGHDRPQAEGQGEGGQVRLPATDHHAVGDGVGRAKHEIAAEAAAWGKPEGMQGGPGADSEAAVGSLVYTSAACSV